MQKFFSNTCTQRAIWQGLREPLQKKYAGARLTHSLYQLPQVERTFFIACPLCHQSTRDRRDSAMSTSLQLFEHPSFGQVRTIERDGGEILFCGKDVAEALGYKDPTMLLSSIIRGVANYHLLETLGGVQDARFITEADL